MTFQSDTPPSGTIRDWLDRRATHADTAAIFIDDGSRITWRELRDAATGIAAMLTTYGIAKGESVAIMHPNGREGLLALYGTFYGGFRATMINLAAGHDAIAYALEHCDARFAFVHPSVNALFAAARPDAMRQIHLPQDRHDTALHSVEPGDDALLMYTSGTTGTPKGVIHSQSSLLAGGWTTALAHRLTQADRGFCVLPIYHINGLCVTVMGALISGGSVSLCAKFSATRFWDQIAGSKATWFSVVPTIISHLLQGRGTPTADTTARLRFGRSASSALPPDMQRAFESRFNVPIIETMGLTETAAQILSNPLPPGTRKIGSPGIAYGNEVAILSPGLTVCGPGIEGEIAVRGPNLLRAYLKNQDATAESFAGDWLRTGDLGRIDADGYIFVTGRLKELIIKGGENIAPREIDEALYSHADVVEAAAFARSCDNYGERVEAAVSLRDGSKLSGADLRGICEKRLGEFKSPDVVHILDALPKGPSGKIQRMKLVDLLTTGKSPV